MCCSNESAIAKNDDIYCAQRHTLVMMAASKLAFKLGNSIAAIHFTKASRSRLCVKLMLAFVIRAIKRSVAANLTVPAIFIHQRAYQLLDAVIAMSLNWRI